MNKIQTMMAGAGLTTILAGIILVIAGVIGWGLNVYQLTQCDFEPSYRAEILRGIGVVIPIVGAVEGYCTIEDVPSVVN